MTAIGQATVPQAAAGPEGADGRRVHRETPPAVLLAVVSLCTTVTVANVYLAQPLLSLIARSLGVPVSAAGWVASVAQLGYATGLLLFAPLGDTVSRRRLVGGLSIAAAVALVGAGAATSLPVLAAAVFAVCAATVVPQLLVPLIAERAPAADRARQVGIVVAGLFAGIVAARVLGGLAGQAYGWRAVYFGAAALTLAVGLTTAALLPPDSRTRRRSSPLRAIASLPRLLAGSAELRTACLRQAGLYGGWSAVWTALALLLTGPHYGLSTASAGMFGLFGLASSVVAPPAGRWTGRLGTTRVVALSYGVVAVSLLLFWWGGQRIAALCAGAVLVHAGLVAGQVANQTRALAATDTPSTANTAYVVSAFAAGATASALAGVAFGHWGWPGVCAVAVLWVAVGALAPLLAGRRSR
ncbi:MFS transporter [Kitasatospora sp. GP82]|uniref:MFS transporter n=1 Tax=Kitasatospora sp. GP82 TaxID=3035089 RepID=UPI00247391F7|nr:MFS transporter [Kitasatospora sp. GP82]MDH6123987.1 putative MFS family arabinose efflux permease [Kitasatospora sp. GP82]